MRKSNVVLTMLALLVACRPPGYGHEHPDADTLGATNFLQGG